MNERVWTWLSEASTATHSSHQNATYQYRLLRCSLRGFNCDICINVNKTRVMGWIDRIFQGYHHKIGKSSSHDLDVVRRIIKRCNISLDLAAANLPPDHAGDACKDGNCCHSNTAPHEAQASGENKNNYYDLTQEAPNSIE